MRPAPRQSRRCDCASSPGCRRRSCPFAVCRGYRLPALSRGLRFGIGRPGVVAERSSLPVNPYRSLGVPRGCTREQAIQAFRARIWSLHPDRGEDHFAFLDACAALNQILAVLDRRARSVRGANRPGQSAPNHDATIRGAAVPAGRKPLGPVAASTASYACLQRVPGYALYRDPHTRELLGGWSGTTAVWAMIPLVPVVSELISPPGKAIDWARVIISAVFVPGMVSVAAIGLWMRDELRDRFYRTAESENAKAKGKTTLFDEL
jgi:hypothetical protein